MIHSNVDFLFAGTVETFRFVTGCIDYFSGFEGFGSLILFCAFVTLFISTVCSSGQRWVELFIKVACLSTIYVNVICSLFAQVYELFSSSCLKKRLDTQSPHSLLKGKMLSVLGNVTLWRRVWTNMIASNLLGSQKKESFHYHMF